MTTPPAASGNILIVDDEPANLDLLADILRSHGLRSRRVLTGRAALAAAAAEIPDLVLLDINLPDLDGYTVCEQLKSQPAFHLTPVIFVSALTETLDKVRAFRCGGVDYVTKPIQVEEVRARIGAQLQLRALQQELAANNATLAANLQQLHQLQELRDNLVHMVVHDIRSPITGMVMTMDLLLERHRSLPPETTTQLKLVRRAATDISDLATSMLDLSRIEAGKMPLSPQPVDLADILQHALSSVAVQADDKQITVLEDASPATATVDPDIVRRILVNLLSNAIRFTSRGGQILTRIQVEPGHCTLLVTDQGPGIPEELHDRLFQKFGDDRLRQAGLKQNVGIGLAFCRMAVEAHGGSIGVQSQPGQGSTFWFTLPRQHPTR